MTSLVVRGGSRYGGLSSIGFEFAARIFTSSSCCPQGSLQSSCDAAKLLLGACGCAKTLAFSRFCYQVISKKWGSNGPWSLLSAPPLHCLSGMESTEHYSCQHRNTPFPELLSSTSPPSRPRPCVSLSQVAMELRLPLPKTSSSWLKPMPAGPPRTCAAWRKPRSSGAWSFWGPLGASSGLS